MSAEALLQAWSIHIERPTWAQLTIILREPLPKEAGRILCLDDGTYLAVEDEEPCPPLPPGVRFSILQRDNYRCRLCGTSAKDGPHVRLEVDHITPRSRGGTNDPSNLWVLCFPCNRGKWKRDL